MATLEEMQLIARLVIGGLLIGAGLVKLRNIEQFQRAVTAYDLIPAPFARYVAVAVVPAELVTGAALVAGLAVTISGAAAAVLLAFFTQVPSRSTSRAAERSHVAAASGRTSRSPRQLCTGTACC